MKRTIFLLVGMLIALAVSSVSFSAQTKDCSKCPYSQCDQKNCPQGIKNCPHCPNGGTACLKSSGMKSGLSSSTIKSNAKQPQSSHALNSSTHENETSVSRASGTVASEKAQR